MPTKTELRVQLRRSRSAIDPAYAQSAALFAAEHLAASPWLRRAQHIALYLDCGSELQTAPLIEHLLACGKAVYVPKIGGLGRMRFLRLAHSTRLRCNRYGIREPTTRRPARGLRHMDLVVLPLVGFDVHGTRLGAGGGYYDRALAFPRVYRKPLLIGYAYAQQQLTSIPAEPWDIRLDAVATEHGISLFNR